MEFCKMRRIYLSLLATAAALAAAAQCAPASAQGYPGGAGQIPGRGSIGQSGAIGPSSIDPSGDVSTPAQIEKSDATARKIYAAGVKSMNRAHEYEEAAAKAATPDKKAKALDHVGDEYGRALDQFTEALSNKGDMVEAWNDVGYVHLRLGAFSESIDDYNHALALKSDLMDAIKHRGEAYLAVDRLDDAKSAYMDLFNHARPLADQLMVSMRKWLVDHRTAANGMRPAVIDSFEKWLQERDGLANQAAPGAASGAAPSLR